MLAKDIMTADVVTITPEASVEEIRQYVDADSLGYLSLEGMLKAEGGRSDEVCTACWTDRQPIALPLDGSRQMGLFEKSRR